MSKKQRPPADPNFYRTKIKKELSFKLSDADIADRGRKMAKIDKELAAMREEFGGIKKEWNEKIKDADEARLKLSAAVDEGEEKRTVECEEERDYAANAIRYLFKGEVKEERLMSLEERQLLVPGTGEKAPPIPITRKRTPGTGNGKKPFDARMAAAGEREEDPEEEARRDLTAVIKEERGRTTKRSSVDGPTKGTD